MKWVLTEKPTLKKLLIHWRWNILQYIFWHNAHGKISNFLLKKCYKALHDTGEAYFVITGDNLKRL